MVISKDLSELFQSLPKLHILYSEELKKHLYIKIGGKADFLIFPKNVSELKEAISYFRSLNIPISVIGKGTNLIVKDGGIRGAVISLKNLNSISVFGDRIKAGAGASLIDVCKVACKYSLTGLEFASGIPGSIGGAVFMNAGAYGGEIKDVLESIVVLDKNNNLKIKTRDDLNFSYRKTNIEENEEIIIEATFKLTPGNKKEIKKQMKHLTKLRKSKQPLKWPSCGSVFKRPPGMYAGKLIQECGLQGYRVGGAIVSKKHANFILNIGGATAKDYLAVIKHVRDVVYEKKGVMLELEVRIVGED